MPVFYFFSRRRCFNRVVLLDFRRCDDGSVQLVGVYLVFSSLILPVLATAKMVNRKRASMVALFVGSMGYGADLVLSALFDLPSGDGIIWVVAFICVFVAVVSYRLSLKRIL